MASEQSSVNAETVEQTKQQIRGLVSEIAQLSKSDLEPHEYYAAFLQRIVSALAAVGGAVWELGEGRRPQLAYQINISETLLDPESEDTARHIRLLNHVVSRNEPQLIPPLAGAGEADAAGNPTRYLLVLAPLQSDGQVEGVIEVFQRPDSQPATQRGYLRFLLQMCELASEWLKSRKLRQFSDRHSLWAQADHFARLVHESLDEREVAYTIANEGRRLIGCDRVSVAIKRGRKCVIEAVSGQDTLENRSNIVAALGSVASRVAASGEALWYEGSTEDLPPQIEQSLEAYVEESYAKSLAVLPLRKPKAADDQPASSAAGETMSEDNTDREIIGALIVEQIESDLPREMLMPRVDLVYEHSARAMANAIDHNSVLFMPLWRMLGKATWVVRARTLPKTLAITAAILLVLLGLAVIPGDFNLEARGSLQPVEKRDVFVDTDGVVTALHVADGDQVAAGDVLVELRNPDLEIEWQEVLGNLQQVQEQLLAVGRNMHNKELTAAERIQLSGQHSQLKQKQETLRRQMKLIETKREQLTVRSPIAGEVILPWEVEKSLLYRPVASGQVLMTVADLSSDWELELFLPERRMGHLTRARDGDGSSESPEEALSITYILATDPGTNRYGKVKDVHSATQLHEEEGHSVQIRADIDKQKLLDDGIEPHPGATVIADIHCGRRSIGFVWFHQVIEWVQRHVLF